MNEFKTFSKKRLEVLSWWNENSPFCNMDGLICDGAVRSGKTSCMSLSFVVWAMFNFNGGDFAICGKTITSVKRNIKNPLVSMLLSFGFSCEEKISANYVTVSWRGKSNRFFFFGGKDESSAALIRGMTLSGILLDEVVLMPESFVSRAVARCSVEGAKFWFNCNPDNPGHWFYTRWIKKCEEKRCHYIHFSMDDNPSLSESVRNRYKNLYSGTFFERFVLGKWVASSGLVYPEAAKGKYRTVCNEEASSFIVSVDYGTVNPFSAGLWGRFDDVFVRVAEYYYDSKKEGEQKTDEEYYAELERLVGSRKIECIVVDPSAASFIQTVRRHGRYSVKKAKNDVADGIRKVRSAFKDGKILIDEKCRDCIREFNLYSWDEKTGKDCVKKENDHAMDDLRYFVSTCVFEDEDFFLAFASSRNNMKGENNEKQ